MIWTNHALTDERQHAPYPSCLKSNTLDPNLHLSFVTTKAELPNHRAILYDCLHLAPLGPARLGPTRRTLA